jgi:conjugal transfer mating pair stabilization protein TraN
VTVTPLIPYVLCATISKNYRVQKDNWFGEFKVITEPSCSNNFHLQASVSGTFWSPTTFTITYHFHNQDKEVVDTWDNACQSLEEEAKGGICKLDLETCTVPKATKNINGVSVTRDCWESTATYQCGVLADGNVLADGKVFADGNVLADSKTNLDSNCGTLRRKGCEQIMSICSTKYGNYCSVYEQTFRCPDFKCSNPTGIVCNGTAFCLDGNCVDQSYKQNDEFAKEASNLTGVMDASKQFDSSNNGNYSIFNGHRLECSRAMMGFYNCCDYKGWGLNWGLIKCSDEEKKLANARKNGLAIKVGGKYCANRRLGKCTSYHNTYCVFQSKQARIIQEQGRGKQLHISFGSAKHPNCQGITPEQMQQIKFDQIDFSEFYEDLNQKAKIPSTSTEIESINQHIQQSYSQGSKHQ